MSTEAKTTTTISAPVTNSAIASGERATASNVVNTLEKVKDLTFDQVCGELKRQINECAELNKEEKDAALEEIDKLSELIKKPDPSNKNSSSRILRALRGALTTVEKLYNGCKSLLDVIPSFFG